MKNPKWFKVNKTHKGIPFGPGDGFGRNRPQIPLCKILNRSHWPSDGCWDEKDKVSYVWRKVDCTRCLSLGGKK